MQIKLVHILFITLVVGIVVLSTMLFVQNQRAVLSFVKSIDKIGLLKNIHQPAALFGETCVVSTDCEGGLVCDINMTCNYCTDQSQCSPYGNTWHCTNPADTGICTNSCSSNAECQNVNSGDWCGKDNVCHTGSCSSSTECETGKICDSGLCQNGNCTTDSECGGQLCSGFYCAPCSTDEQCTTSSAYGSGYWCSGNVNAPDARICRNSCSNYMTDCGWYTCGGSSCTQSCGRNSLCYNGPDFTCTTNTECQSGEICNFSDNPHNFCGMGSEGGLCSTDADCYGAGETCSGGTCIAGCTSSSECSGQICSNGSCIPCTQSSECAMDYGESYICTQGGSVCRDNTTTCAGDSDCETGSWCGQDTYCHSSCTVNTDCQSGYGCVNTSCISLTCNPSDITNEYCYTNFGETWWCGQGSYCFEGTGSCTSNSDCQLGSVCDSGSCYVGNCIDNTTCNGYACSSHNCLTDCSGSGDGDCDGSNYYTCDSGNSCRPTATWADTSSTWNSSSSWTGATYSGNDNLMNVVINSSFTYPIVSDVSSAYDVDLNNSMLLEVTGQGNLTIAGTLSLSGGSPGATVNNAGTINVASLNLDSGASITNTGTITITSNFINNGGGIMNGGTINCPSGLMWSDSQSNCLSATCSSNGECSNNFGNDYFCSQAGVCRGSSSCTLTSECAGGYWCGRDLSCHYDCVYNSACESGYICSGGSCVMSANGGTCATNDDCASGEECTSGTCGCPNGTIWGGGSCEVVYTFNWTGASNTSWNNAGNWSPSMVPIATGTAYINEASNYPTIDSGLTIGVGVVFNADGVLLTNNGTISTGTWSEGGAFTSGILYNYGIIEGGTFEIISCENYTGGTINDGQFNCSTIYNDSGATINNGYFDHMNDNSGTIENGTFGSTGSGTVVNSMAGIINGGTFNVGLVTNGNIINDGTFNYNVTGGTITGGTFNGTVTSATVNVVGILDGSGTIEGDVSVTSTGQIIFNNANLTITGSITCATVGEIWNGSVCEAPGEVCGNSVLEGTETCDDGNTTAGDGCSSSCRIEADYECTGTPSVCIKCGNGIKEGIEGCDDANNINGDGCSATCTVESGYTCNGTTPSICQKCGNGIKEGTETCDDGNTNNGDGCSATCSEETGFDCTGSLSICRFAGSGGASAENSTTTTPTPTTPNTTPTTPQINTTFTNEQLIDYSVNIINKIKDLLNQDLGINAQHSNIPPANRSKTIQLLQRLLESLKQLLKLISFKGILNFV